MDIRSIRHKGLRRLVENDDGSGLPPAYLDKLRKMVSFLQEMGDASVLRSVPSWKVHSLTGHRRGTTALHVSPNWRLTFGIDAKVKVIVDLNFEDYH